MLLLQEKRKERGLSQAELAAISGVSQQAISKIESKTSTNPGIETVALLAKALNCHIMEIYVPEKEEQ